MTIAINNVSEESYLMKECLEHFFMQEFTLANVFIIIFLNLPSKASQLHAIVQS